MDRTIELMCLLFGGALYSYNLQRGEAKLGIMTSCIAPGCIRTIMRMIMKKLTEACSLLSYIEHQVHGQLTPVKSRYLLTDTT